MTDIVEMNLRRAAYIMFMDGYHSRTMATEAADKIVRLNAEIERLRLSLSEARATGRLEGMEEAARIADDMPILRRAAENHLRANKPQDVAAAIRAAKEK